jgi:inner membrane protein
MDPITHGLLGACAVQVGLRRRADLPLTGAGFLAAMAPDLDLFIRSSQDPILPWIIHRQFSHCLLFIPVGGLIVASLLWIFYRRHYTFKWIYLAATLGYATHGPLDAFTSYGTLLFWPLSRERVSWDILPIVDPVFTFMLFLGFIFSLLRHRARPAVLALCGVALYTMVAVHLHQRGLVAQHSLAVRRGQILTRGRVMPTLGNILVWRSLYESSGRLYADALRIPPFGEIIFWAGESGEEFQKKDVPLGIPPDSKLEHDLDRLRWFADDYLILLNRELGVIGDVRFSTQIGGLEPLWGTRAHWDHPQEGLQKIRFRRPLRGSLQELWEQILGTFSGSRSLPPS